MDCARLAPKAKPTSSRGTPPPACTPLLFRRKQCSASIFLTSRVAGARAPQLVRSSLGSDATDTHAECWLASEVVCHLLLARLQVSALPLRRQRGCHQGACAACAPVLLCTIAPGWGAGAMNAKGEEAGWLFPVDKGTSSRSEVAGASNRATAAQWPRNGHNGPDR